MEHSRLSSSALLCWLNSTDRPFVVATETASCEEWQSDPDKKWFVLDGKEMPDWTAAFRYLKNVFHLPDYFGNNLNALEECLSDADVLQGAAFVVQIRNASHTLNADGADELTALINCFSRVAEEWAKPVNLNEPWDRPAIPFHVILCGTGAELRFSCYSPIPNSPPQRFETSEGEVRLWIEQESLHVKCITSHGDPVELTKEEAAKFAEALLTLSAEIEL